MKFQKGTLVADALPGKICAYFTDNPEEELTYADAACKFDVTLKALNAALGRARSVGNIETVTLIRAKR